MYFKVIALIFSFVFGAVIGSAFLCFLDRRGRGEKWTKGKSHCTCCGHELAPKDLIPIVSYIALKGKCRYCGEPYSPAALLSEISMGCAGLFSACTAFLLVSERNVPKAVASALIYVFLGLGAVNDIYSHECEYVIQYGAFLIGTVYALMYAGGFQLICMIVLFVVLMVLDLIFRKKKKVESAIGYADIVVITGAAGILQPIYISVGLFFTCVFALISVPIAKANQQGQGTTEEGALGVGFLPFVLYGTFIAEVLSIVI